MLCLELKHRNTDVFSGKRKIELKALLQKRGLLLCQL